MYTFELTMIDMENDNEYVVTITVDENCCDNITEKEIFIWAMSKAFDTCKEYGENFMFSSLNFISC